MGDLIDKREPSDSAKPFRITKNVEGTNWRHTGTVLDCGGLAVELQVIMQCFAHHT